ncbi:MAG: ABC transporter ATP-binding protein/permease [Deltaproteobacteria bacterium]|jgi:ATP-binding cassette subfamily B protein|nr:ABC transporter ATP-binding protein/permease [Deltaproteobacteria bacterium]
MEAAREEELGRPYDLKILGWLWTFLRPYRGLLGAALLLMPLSSAFSLAQPYLARVMIDAFIAPPASAPASALRAWLVRRPERGFLLMGVVYLGALLGEVAAFYGQFYFSMAAAQYALADLRVRLFRHVQRLPMAILEATPVGRVVSRLTTDVDAINEMFSAGALTILMDAASLAGIVAIMFAIDAGLSLKALATVSPVLLFVTFFRRQARRIYRDVRVRLAAINTYLSETLAGMSVVQLFTREKVAWREFDALSAKSRDAQVIANIYEAGLYSAVETLSSVAVAILIWIGGGQVVHRAIGLGTLVAFIEYVKKFFMPLRDLSTKYAVLQSALAGAERVKSLLELPEEPRGAPAALPGGLQPTIVFDNVSFAYRPGEPVLKNLSLQIEAGQTVAVVGPTGSGKTTLTRLLTRFYLPAGGRILVGGRDVRDWDLETLRRTIGLVQQDVFLFSTSVADNLRPSRARADGPELRALLAKSRVLEFLDRLPRGLAEEVRERGANFSAGERQLIAFARALAYDPPILVLDEATSSLDPQTEHLVELALDDLLLGRTALIVAHRFATIRRADRIVVLSGGRLRESGSHEQLIAKRGLYWRLFQLQYAADPEAACGG